VEKGANMKKNNNTGRDLKIEDAKEIGRGMLTTDINNVAELMIGRKISKRELCLIPYIQYVMCNDRKLKIHLINQEEREILHKWKEEGHIKGGACGLAVTKQFWDFMCEVLFLGYVGYDNPEIVGDLRG
jgi:hypothetical protein